MTQRTRIFNPDHVTHLGEARRDGGAYSPALTHADLDTAVRNILQAGARDGVLQPKDGINVPDPTDPNSGAPIEGGRPCAPTDLTAETGANGDLVWIDFTWTAGTCINNGSVYEVELRRTDDPLEAQFPIVRTTADTTIRFEGLEGATPYDCRVRAISHAGRFSEWSSTLSTTSSVDDTIPATVAGVTASAGLRTVVVSWTEAAEGDVKNGNGTYEITLATNNTFSTGVKTMKKSGTVTSFGDLVPNTTYYVRVRAIDKSGNASAAWSTTQSTTTAQAGTADISTGAVTADLISAGAVITSKLDADAVTAAKISAIALESGKYISSTTYSAGSAGWRINASGNAEFNNITIRGTVYASVFQTSEGTAKVRMGSAATAADEIQFIGASGSGASIRNGEFVLGYANSLRISAGGIIDSWATGGRGYLQLTAPNLGAGTGGVIDMQAASVSMSANVSATTLTTGLLVISSSNVTYGANDSGGSGYKVLRIPNAGP